MPDKVSAEQQTDAPAKPEVASPPLARKPPTEDERAALQLEKLKGESDDTRSKRRAAELQALSDTHLENVKNSHKRYPTPNVPYAQFTPAEQKRWQEKRKDLDQANRAYHLAVRRTCGQHRAEDAMLIQLRAEAAAKEAA
jgi:hypothetical protein